MSNGNLLVEKFKHGLTKKDTRQIQGCIPNCTQEEVFDTLCEMCSNYDYVISSIQEHNGYFNFKCIRSDVWGL